MPYDEIIESSMRSVIYETLNKKTSELFFLKSNLIVELYNDNWNANFPQ